MKQFDVTLPESKRNSKESTVDRHDVSRRFVLRLLEKAYLN